jgi:hypothetical protein
MVSIMTIDWRMLLRPQVMFISIPVTTEGLAQMKSRMKLAVIIEKRVVKMARSPTKKILMESEKVLVTRKT